MLVDDRQVGTGVGRELIAGTEIERGKPVSIPELIASLRLNNATGREHRSVDALTDDVGVAAVAGYAETTIPATASASSARSDIQRRLGNQPEICRHRRQ